MDKRMKPVLYAVLLCAALSGAAAAQTSSTSTIVAQSTMSVNISSTSVAGLTGQQQADERKLSEQITALRKEYRKMLFTHSNEIAALQAKQRARHNAYCATHRDICKAAAKVKTPVMKK